MRRAGLGGWRDPVLGTSCGVSDGLTLGVEEELHVVDRSSRELVPRAPEVLDRLPAGAFSAELHRSVVETNSRVTRRWTACAPT